MITPPYAFPAWFLGLDLGQRRDYTALATLETIWTYIGRDAVTFEHRFDSTLNICGLRRFPLGTSYAEYPRVLSRRITQIREAAAPPGRIVDADISLVVDAGGPGGPVVDELRRARLRASIYPVLITGGSSPGRAANGYRTVPRRDLVSNLVLLLDHKVLRWPDGLPERQTLEHELLQLSAGTTHPEASGAHDDIVMAVAIAAWQARIHSPKLLAKTTAKDSKLWTPHGRLFW